jgi:hypothetical protein
MGLRTKLVAGYLVFIAALVVLGGWGAWRLREMGDVSRRIIANNYDSVVAAQEMKESLERQDSAAVFALLGARERAAAQTREHRAKFDSNFRKAAHNITEPGEPEIVETIRRDRDDYYRAFDDFLARINAEGKAATTPAAGEANTSTASNPGSINCGRTARASCSSTSARCSPSPRPRPASPAAGSTSRC